MYCLDCLSTEKERDVVGVCHSCGAGICIDHAAILPVYLVRTGVILREERVDPPARELLCPTCLAARRASGKLDALRSGPRPRTGVRSRPPEDAAIACQLAASKGGGGMKTDSDLREEVRSHYAEAAHGVTVGTGVPSECCSPGTTCAEEGHASGPAFYGQLSDERIPETAVRASLGCGNPTSVADLHPGEIVLDLGSGGGIDVLLSAKRVGPTGKVYGLDMTEEMLALAIKNCREAGATNVEFLKGFIEDVPLPANTVDVVISNCVINLSTNKPRVFAEMARVLRPGGRIGISDVVADDDLTPAERAERGSYVGCVAGALSFEEYDAGLRAAGFEDISISSTSEYLPDIHAAIVKATKPSG